jgi:chemotaxis protein CheX
VEDFLSADNLCLADQTVAEIFQMMFGLEITPIEGQIPNGLSPDSDERTAIVGFSGAMRGSCQIRMTTPAAQSVASAMLGGAPIEDGDDSINDALGELCNMLAGGWKSGIAPLSSECALSPPTVISGRNYKVHISKPSIKVARSYTFQDHALHLALFREDVEPFAE